MTRALSLGIVLILLPALRAAEPLVVELPARVSVNTRAVTVASVCKITGGSAHGRAKLGRIDLAEIGHRDSSVNISRRLVEYRLRLAGYEDDDFIVLGAERT